MAQKTLNQWLDYISSTHPSEINLGLDRVRSVFQNMHIDHRAKKIIVVSGTNGKGSTIALMEAGFRSLGYSVGSYTSPHIQHYNERVRINALAVSDRVLVSSFECVELARQNTSLTYFEFGTLAAFDILFSANLDVIIMEVGLGGRLDAVNIIDADLSVITSVALDHTDWLGDSIDGIGFEKAGILRCNKPFLAGEGLPDSVFKRAVELNCDTQVFAKDFGVDFQQGIFLKLDGSTKYFGDLPELRLPNNNVLLALQVVAMLASSLALEEEGQNFGFVWSTVKSAFNEVLIPGRLEKLDLQEKIYLDVGHNPQAAGFLKIFLSQLISEGNRIQVVYSSLADKDVESIVEILSPVVDSWLIAPLGVERALAMEDLERKVGAGAKNMLSFPNVTEAITYAVDQCAKTDNTELVTLIFGSFFMIETAKNYFEGL